MYVNAARGKKKPKIEGLMVYKNMGILVICEATLKGRGEEFMNQLGMECLEDFDAAERVVKLSAKVGDIVQGTVGVWEVPCANNSE